ncbi:hypothetical protein ACM0P6_13850 [Komagataeibacter sucrofermentans]|uniref:hypothetical protein n=1 Tax=Komagataeibacter sucrofermentans TaxID=1053551 RepID=UPI0011B467FF|nr:hypothetical protein [Komagataeibacter sucrofermentans]
MDRVSVLRVSCHAGTLPPVAGGSGKVADIHVVNALSQNFFVKNVVGKHIFVVFMPLCVTGMKYSARRNRHALLLFHCFKLI